MTDQDNPQEPTALPEKPKDEGEAKSQSAIEPEVLERLPPEVRKVVESFSLQAFAGPIYNPVLKKITESHIDKVLDQTEKDSERGFKDAQSTKKYNLYYALLFSALFVFVIAFLADKNPELLKDMIKYLAVFAGGYGFKSFMDRRNGE